MLSSPLLKPSIGLIPNSTILEILPSSLHTSIDLISIISFHWKQISYFE